MAWHCHLSFFLPQLQSFPHLLCPSMGINKCITIQIIILTQILNVLQLPVPKVAATLSHLYYLKNRNMFHRQMVRRSPSSNFVVPLHLFDRNTIPACKWSHKLGHPCAPSLQQPQRFTRSIQVAIPCLLPQISPSSARTRAGSSCPPHLAMAHHPELTEVHNRHILSSTVPRPHPSIPIPAIRGSREPRNPGISRTAPPQLSPWPAPSSARTPSLPLFCIPVIWKGGPSHAPTPTLTSAGRLYNQLMYQRRK
jgi:hypothetical protein